MQTPKNNVGLVVGGVSDGVMALITSGRHGVITEDGWSPIQMENKSLRQGYNLFSQHHKGLVVVKTPVVLG